MSTPTIPTASMSAPRPDDVASSSQAAHTNFGPIGRMGEWAATHVRATVLAWLVIVVVLGALAPRVETALSGAGWEASGSESVQARNLVQRHFAGASSSALVVAVYSPTYTAQDPEFRKVAARVMSTLDSSAAVGKVQAPQAGSSISADGHTALVMGGARRDPTGMVAAADVLRVSVHDAGSAGVRADLTGSPGMWADFNQANRSAMMKSELYSWPITLAILVLAFGSLVAAGLPLLLTIIGLASSAGVLYLGTHVAHISVWAMNFALMFALALGIDYALFVVHRYRGALFGSKLTPRQAVGETMDTAGKAVLFSGLTVLVSLSAVLLVPSPAFRSMSLGIMLSVVFVLAATMTLLPALLGALGTRVDALSLPWVHAGEHRSPRFAAWGERLWRRPRTYGAIALVALIALALPAIGLRTGMPSIKVVPAADGSRIGYGEIQRAFGAGAPGVLQIVVPQRLAKDVVATAWNVHGIASVSPAQPGSGGLALIQADTDYRPLDACYWRDDRSAAGRASCERAGWRCDRREP